MFIRFFVCLPSLAFFATRFFNKFVSHCRKTGPSNEVPDSKRNSDNNTIWKKERNYMNCVALIGVLQTRRCEHQSNGFTPNRLCYSKQSIHKRMSSFTDIFVQFWVVLMVCQSKTLGQVLSLGMKTPMETLETDEAIHLVIRKHTYFVALTGTIDL